ncbi:phosphatidylinositol 4-kinase gamma 7-like [Rutidosis leptorrhynchoides]|uniref:phosphatidylinositol 4-kinase gamma 7-like n=1 Tax=Rutidosis leptorrhynchoides TaxID=125765 RepID=UPI003A99B18F
MEGPVQNKIVMSHLNGPHHSDYDGDGRFNGKLCNKRRVFVQTENGCVLGMDLERKDNAHIVKRRMQLSLNIPMDESSLTFGDMVLNNDLSAIKNDSALLLTKKIMQRSSSTPCLSPTGRALQQKDQSNLVEIIGQSGHFTETYELVEEIINGLKSDVEPVPVNGGLGGAYYFKNQYGESVAIVKPTDEEPFAPNNPKGFVGKVLGQPGLKPSVRVGETGFREVAAYLLDHDHFARVPLTCLVKISHSIFNLNDCVNGNKIMNSKVISKIASLQQFIPHDFDASDHGTSRFPVADVHRIGILDVRIFNTDRHAGNLLVKRVSDGQFGELELIPIDHGLCLPECLEDPYFEWIHWPQASIPFSEIELEYINKLDPISESEMLRRELPMIRETCIRVLTLCTVFLKKAAAFGLCLAEIGQMMSREFRCKNQKPSELEVVCLEAIRQVLSYSDSEEKTDAKHSNVRKHSMASTGAMSCKKLGLGKKGRGNGRVKTGLMGVRSSAQELVGAPTSFVKVGDMNDDEWWWFLEKFQELVGPAMAARKVSSVSLRNNLRLGRSCQF